MDFNTSESITEGRCASVVKVCGSVELGVLHLVHAQEEEEEFIPEEEEEDRPRMEGGNLLRTSGLGSSGPVRLRADPTFTTKMRRSTEQVFRVHPAKPGNIFYSLKAVFSLVAESNIATWHEHKKNSKKIASTQIFSRGDAARR